MLESDGQTFWLVLTSSQSKSKLCLAGFLQLIFLTSVRRLVQPPKLHLNNLNLLILNVLAFSAEA